ncbi:hypothetical protein OHV82_17975 [Acinetobacter baumannii]|nr:hypothetical protein [Acinetobacter baumannii]
MNSMVQITNNSNFEALLTFEEIEKYETNEVGVMRRITLASLTQSFNELLHSTLNSEDDDGEAFLELLNCSSNCVEYFKEMLQLAEQAQKRLAMVGYAYLEQQEKAK